MAMSHNSHDDRVLEAASGADERHAALPGVADRREGAVHASVRAGRRDPDTVEPAQPVAPVAGGVGRHPFRGQVDVLQRIAREPMCAIRGIEVSDNGDTDTVADHRALTSSRA